MNRIFFLLVIFGMLGGICQKVKAQNSTLGKEFWVGFMENYQEVGDPDEAVLVITADEKATGSIAYLGRSAAFDLAKGQQYEMRISTDILDLLHRTSEQIENKGIYITSSGRVAVHAFNQQGYTADGTVVLPVKTLGKEYLITSHYEEGNGPSTLLVVATEDQTQIEITPAVATENGRPAQAPYEVTLNRGQSYQVKANGDLTGSKVKVIGENVEDCKRIAVFGGSMCAYVGGCLACDHLYQQMYPISTWGTSYVHVALKGRTSGEMVKVLASEDATEVIVAGENKGQINNGQAMTLDLAKGFSCKIETSKPASVTVFSKGMGCNDGEDIAYSYNGDPFMITYSPSGQFLKEIVFNSIKLPVIDRHYVNIVVKAGTENQTYLDGEMIGDNFSSLPGDAGFQIARISISEGGHHLANAEGFAAYAYGFGLNESYGYAAGAALDNMSLDFSSTYEFEVEGDKVACLNEEGTWNVSLSDSTYQYLIWDFGDGSPLQYGQDVRHTFTEVGSYVVSVTASKSPNSCDEQEEASFEVEVLASTAAIEGEPFVCPETEEIMYYLTEQQHVFKTEVEIVGGEMLANYTDSLLVKWGAPRDDAKIIVTPFSEKGCPGVPIEFGVTIGPFLRALDPIGSEYVCFDPLVSHTYLADPIIPGRKYEWDVSGGIIKAGQGTGMVEVVWDQPNIQGEIGYRVFIEENDQCYGESTVLEVEVTARLAEAQVTHVACFGGASGKIQLDMVGGRPPYTFDWAHDPGLTLGEAEGLPKGTYSVRITDQNACSQTLSGIEVTEPLLLEVAGIAASPVTCFGRSDGIALISIVGGVGPYRIDDQGGIEIDQEVLLNELAVGEYHFEVTDQNDCRVMVDFEITAPPPLEAEVRLVKPACPGEENGELIVVTEGIVGPREFNWIGEDQYTELAIGLAKGEYDVELRDVDGCVYMGKGTVDEAAPELRMPTGFDPRQAPGLYHGVSNCQVRFDLWVYNRWGELIYFGSEGWSGAQNGKAASAGMYAYVIKYYYTLEGKEYVIDGTGSFMLIR